MKIRGSSLQQDPATINGKGLSLSFNLGLSDYIHFNVFQSTHLITEEAIESQLPMFLFKTIFFYTGGPPIISITHFIPMSHYELLRKLVNASIEGVVRLKLVATILLAQSKHGHA